MVDGPYLGLLAYEETNARFFFGRERETAIVAANLVTAPLTIVYGPSGAGKSSLLRAGVVNFLRRVAVDDEPSESDAASIPIVFNSWRDDPSQGILLEVQAALRRSGVELSEEMPGTPGFAATLEAWSETHHRRFLIILDQFEEFFLYCEQSPGYEAFARDFAHVVRQPTSATNFLISIREDALAKLDFFQATIPYLFRNYLRVDHLSMAAARAAIEQPIKEYNRQRRETLAPVTLEPELVDAVLDQVRTGRVSLAGEAAGGETKSGSREHSHVEAPYLQIVMRRLWDEELNYGSKQLRRATLASLGEAASIIRGHLDQALSALDERDQDIAAQAFHHLVTPTGSKIALSISDIATYTRIPELELKSVLNKLATPAIRILRPVPPPLDQPTLIRYEISHDVLGPGMQERWRKYAEKQAEQAARTEAERVRNELLNERQRHRTEVRGRLFGAVAFTLLIVLVLGVTLAMREGWHIVGEWTDLQGPPGGEVRPLLIDPRDPTIVLAQVLGSDGALYRSTDSGGTWSAVRQGLTNAVITHIAADPMDSARLYLSTLGSGIFRSDDDGVTWMAINEGLSSYAVTWLYAHPEKPGLVFASASGVNGGVYGSENGGDNWQLLSGRGLQSDRAERIVPDPADPDLFYVLTDYNVYRTRNAGETFELTDYDMLPAVTQLLISDANQRVFLAAAEGGRLWLKSGDDEDWTPQVFGGPLDKVTGLFRDSSTSSTFYLSAFRERDGYAFLRSDDSGQSWREATEGLTKSFVLDMISSSQPTAPMYLGTGGAGLFRSNDRGRTWEELAVGRGRLRCVTIAVNSFRPNELWASATGALLRSDDGGATWELSMTGLPSGTVGPLLFGPASPDTIMAGLYRPGVGESIFRSTDGGRTWHPTANGVSDDDVTALLAIGDPPVYFAATGGSGVYRSSDGANWTQANAGLSRLDVVDLVSKGAVAPVLLAATPAGIYRSVDLGEKWVAASRGLNDLNLKALAVDHSPSGPVYAATRDGGMYVSRDAGQSWTEASEGLDRLRMIDVVADPQSEDVAYAATDSGGSFRTTDGGRRWVSISRGAPSNLVSALAMPASGPNYLYVAAFDLGIFRFSTRLLWEQPPE